MSGCYGWRLLELHGDVIEAVVGVAPAPPGNIQKPAPVHAETETDIEVEAFGTRVRVDKTAPVVGSRDFVERKLVGASRYFPRDRLDGYAASLLAIPPRLWLERQNVHGSQLRVSDPHKARGQARAWSSPAPRISTIRARSTPPSSPGSMRMAPMPTSAFWRIAVSSATATC